MRNIVGQTTNAEFISSDKRARITGGLYITFLTSENVTQGDLFEVNVDDRWYTFKATDITIQGKDLLVKGREYGYYDIMTKHIKELDLRYVIDHDVALITDEKRINDLYKQACFC